MTSLFSAGDLTHALGGRMTQPFHASGVSIDTRTLQPGDLFVALQTQSGDGHDHVAAAIAKGAAGALVHRQHALPDDAPLIVVGDTLAALTALGAFARSRFTGAVAAITGSVGKTTTKEMLRTILEASGRTHAAVASYNNHWGVPLTLARMPADADYAIVEIGMNHPGEIRPLAELAAPDIAVITAVEPAHIGHMGSLEAIADEKASIAHGVLQGGAIVLPASTPHLPRLVAATGGRRILTFGPPVEIIAEAAGGTTFSAEIAGIIYEIRLNIPGRHMVMNALAALTTAQALGADMATSVRALADFRAVGGRGVQRPILDGRATLIDESYNASSASVRAALSVLKLTQASRKLAVLGDMLELGTHSRTEHESLAAKVEDCADLLYCCGPDMRLLYDRIAPAKRGAHTPDSLALAPLIAQSARPGDAILVKGSLGSRMAIIVDQLTTLPARSV